MTHPEHCMRLEEQLETTNCPLCGAVDEKHLYVKDGFNIVKCKQCHLVYVNPRLSAKALEELYNANEISPQHYFELNISQDLTHFRKRLAIIERYRNGGLLLDIGTNIGTMLKVAKDNGWSVRGIEFNRKAVAFGRQRFGVNIEDRDFMRSRFDAESFDVITMNDVIEHVIDPIATLKEVCRILKRDGVLFLTTPNIAAAIARISGRRWLHLKPTEHLTYFTPKVIALLLKNAGFKILHLQSIGHIRSLETIFQKSRSYSSVPYVISRIIPKWIREHISVHINSRDEMAVVAQKIPE